MGKKLRHWYTVSHLSARMQWQQWTGKKSMLGWCTGDCLSHPINWNYKGEDNATW